MQDAQPLLGDLAVQKTHGARRKSTDCSGYPVGAGFAETELNLEVQLPISANEIPRWKLLRMECAEIR